MPTLLNTNKIIIEMKKVILSIALSIVAFMSYAQNNIQLTVRWSSSNSRYEVYARPNFTQTSLNLSNSQVSVVVPASVADSRLIVTSVAGGTWSEPTTGGAVYAPSAQASNDFHAVGNGTGAPVGVTSGTELLLFTFTLPGGQCVDGIRLFNNTTDPGPSAAGMSGGDFRNSLASGVTQYYASNYDNTGTQCNPCNITAPELTKQ